MGALSVRQVQVSRRRVWYRPWLEVLEARLPPGDALLGVLVGGVLLEPAFAAGGTELRTPGLAGGRNCRRRLSQSCSWSDRRRPTGRPAVDHRPRARTMP